MPDDVCIGIVIAAIELFDVVLGLFTTPAGRFELVLGLFIEGAVGDKMRLADAESGCIALGTWRLKMGVGHQDGGGGGGGKEIPRGSI